MGKHHYQDSYKGILYSVTKVDNEYQGYLIDIEYTFGTFGESQEEVLTHIKSFIDSL